jgi:hypothetical protein
VERWVGQVADPWLRVRAEAVLGELARVERRFDDAVAHLEAAWSTSSRLGFRQTAAYQRSSLGRAQLQVLDYESGIATLSAAIADAEATGDLRMAALARVHLGRALRATGDRVGARAALEDAAAFHRRVGGGEQAALGDCLLAAMDGDAGRLEVLLAEAQVRGDAPVEVFALDALGRRAEADERMSAADHFITGLDRVDAGGPGRPLVAAQEGAEAEGDHGDADDLAGAERLAE